MTTLLFSGSVTDYLRGVIAERFNVNDLPDGFFYFPVELGGLELRNTFIPFLAMREDIKRSPKRTLQKAFLEDENNYHAVKGTVREARLIMEPHLSEV